MSSWIIQLIISLGGAGLVVQLLLLRQNRRKIAGDASASEANAASTLSGAAMKMVENAQAKEREAEERSEVLNRRLDEAQERRELDVRELQDRAWRIHHLELRQAVLENALRQVGIEIPELEYDDRGTRPPELGPGPRPTT